MIKRIALPQFYQNRLSLQSEESTTSDNFVKTARSPIDPERLKTINLSPKRQFKFMTARNPINAY